MKPNDTFVLDAQAIQETAEFTKVALSELQKKLSEGDTFSISKRDKLNTNVVRGVRWVDGKPQKGRPRRFPRATVARLLNFDDSAFQAAQEAAEAAAVAEVAQDEQALESRAEELLGATVDAAPSPNEDSSW